MAVLRTYMLDMIVKGSQLQEETRTRLARKFITLTGPREGGPTCHERPQGKYQVAVAEDRRKGKV